MKTNVWTINRDHSRRQYRTSRGIYRVFTCTGFYSAHFEAGSADSDKFFGYFNTLSDAKRACMAHCEHESEEN